jgi:hypothetical protein
MRYKPSGGGIATSHTKAAGSHKSHLEMAVRAICQGWAHLVWRSSVTVNTELPMQGSLRQVLGSHRGCGAENTEDGGLAQKRVFCSAEPDLHCPGVHRSLPMGMIDIVLIWVLCGSRQGRSHHGCHPMSATSQPPALGRCLALSRTGVIIPCL